MSDFKVGDKVFHKFDPHDRDFMVERVLLGGYYFIRDKVGRGHRVPGTEIRKVDNG